MMTVVTIEPKASAPLQFNMHGAAASLVSCKMPAFVEALDVHKTACMWLHAAKKEALTRV